MHTQNLYNGSISIKLCSNGSTQRRVKSASMVSHLPFSYSKSADGMIIEGAAPPPPGQKPIVFVRKIDPKYFETLQVPLVKGRFFDDRDPGSSPVAIVNETMARRCWPGLDPVGRRFGGDEKNWITVVGVVGDMRQSSLGEPPDMEAYMPHPEMPDAAMAIVVRTNTDALHLAPTLRSAVNELDKQLPVSDVGTLAGSIAHSTREQRFTVALLGAFALLALALASVGIYGVISYTVTCRTREIGVRMTLGAERRRIIGMVVSRALLLGSIGVAVGIAAALALTRFLRSLLFGVSATDPVVFAGVSLFLLVVTAQPDMCQLAARPESIPWSLCVTNKLLLNSANVIPMLTSHYGGGPVSDWPEKTRRKMKSSGTNTARYP